MSVPPPKNATLNLTYTRLFDYCRKNKIKIDNIFDIKKLSSQSILIGSCCRSNCTNKFQKRYGELLRTNGFCNTCKNEKNIEQLELHIKNKTENKKIMTLQQINIYIKQNINAKLDIMLLDNQKLDFSGIICGGFKTGTCTLQQTFLFPRTHTLYFCDLKNENSISKLIVSFRENESVYKSAFFQDITIPDYGYCPFAKGNFLEQYLDLPENEKRDIINKVDVKLLVEHYNKIDWDEYMHLNNKNRIAILNQYYNIQIDYNSKELQIFNLKLKNNNPFKIIAINIDTLNKNFEQLKSEIYNSSKPNIEIYNSPTPDIKLIKANIGSEKWYSSKYKEFLTAMTNTKII